MDSSLSPWAPLVSLSPSLLLKLLAAESCGLILLGLGLPQLLLVLQLLLLLKLSSATLLSSSPAEMSATALTGSLLSSILISFSEVAEVTEVTEIRYLVDGVVTHSSVIWVDQFCPFFAACKGLLIACLIVCLDPSFSIQCHSNLSRFQETSFFSCYWTGF